MNRIQSPSSSPAPSFHGFTSLDRSSSELGELLTRLQKTVLHADPEREQRLRRSEYERAKLEAVRGNSLQTTDIPFRWLTAMLL